MSVHFYFRKMENKHHREFMEISRFEIKDIFDQVQVIFLDVIIFILL